MITVKVRLFATLRRYRPGLGLGESLTVKLPAGATVADLIAHLGLPPQEVKFAYVNHIVRRPEHPLADGDDVGLFPPVGGG